MSEYSRPLVVSSDDASLRRWLEDNHALAQEWSIAFVDRRSLVADVQGAVWLIDARDFALTEFATLEAFLAVDGLAIALVPPSGVAHAVAAMRSGFYLACEAQDLLDTLAQVRQDTQTGAQVAIGALSLAKQSQRRLAALTPKERDVLDLVLAGLPNKNIARRLGYSLKTIKVRRQTVMRKLQVESLAELVRVVMAAEPHWRLPERFMPAAPAGAHVRVDAPLSPPAPIALGMSVTAGAMAP